MKIHESAVSTLVIASSLIFKSIQAAEFMDLKKIPKSSLKNAEVSLKNTYAIAASFLKRTDKLNDQESQWFQSGLFDLALYFCLDEIETNYNADEKKQKKNASFANARQYFSLIKGFQKQKFDALIQDKMTSQKMVAKIL